MDLSWPKYSEYFTGSTFSVAVDSINGLVYVAQVSGMNIYYMRACEIRVLMWRSEDSFWDLVLFSYEGVRGWNSGCQACSENIPIFLTISHIQFDHNRKERRTFNLNIKKTKQTKKGRNDLPPLMANCIYFYIYYVILC